MPPSFEVRVAEAVRQQAMEAARYIAQDSPQAALEFIERFDKALESLEQMPQRGTLPPENKRWKAEYRQLFVEPYRLIYRVKAKNVLVLRLTHGAQRAQAAPPK